jgi:site-specific DNA-methyltransferase (adenine-specific)
MTTQSAFVLRGRNPDILACIANLSNDEVFTPPELANQMLDSLAEAWASNNNGASIWADKNVRFLDPCTKSGVFLREITRRLTEGLKDVIPDLETRVDHILTNQVFGIAITQITSLLARRSLYCSKRANGEHSIAESFTDEAGNVWFERTKHTWDGAKCRFCSAPKLVLDRSEGMENYAYPFIHSDDIKTWTANTFGGNMQFDVIIGNPPYQLSNGDSSDIPIYQHFVAQSKALAPRYLSMVIPSRWMAGGKGLDEFRAEMLGDHRISHLVDYRVSKEIFQGVEVKGGICYFLWSDSHKGTCLVSSVRGQSRSTAARHLNEFDVFVRDVEAVGVLKKVLSLNEPSMLDLVSGQTPFGLITNFSDFHTTRKVGDLGLHYNRAGRREIAFVRSSQIQKGQPLIGKWKLLAPMAGSDGGQRIPDVILGEPIISKPDEVCTQTYLAIGPLRSKQAAESLEAYYRTKFFRFLISLRKITQHAGRATYTWVPQQSWDREWTDRELYKKYKLTKVEIAFIESMIRPMDDGDE